MSCILRQPVSSTRLFSLVSHGLLHRMIIEDSPPTNITDAFEPLFQKTSSPPSLPASVLVPTWVGVHESTEGFCCAAGNVSGGMSGNRYA